MGVGADLRVRPSEGEGGHLGVFRPLHTVMQWFKSHGLANLQFKTAGFGAKKPIAPNQKPDGSDDPEGRQKNRRVEIVITK